MKRGLVFWTSSTIIVIALFAFVFVPTTTREPRTMREPHYVSSYDNKLLTCGDTRDEFLGHVKVSFSKNGKILLLQIGERQIQLAFAGGDTMSDYYGGGASGSVEVEIDPEFRHSNLFGDSE